MRKQIQKQSQNYVPGMLMHGEHGLNGDGGLPIEEGFASYAAAMLISLQRLARANGQAVLAYLIGMAVIEAKHLDGAN